ncbi:MAG: hypothetical protein A2V77_08590 [Anaeromyxobacter sp. RBG_16_69_14]|nr:MAG: hypothetical protein A2V77_08590 [Anaeromyxobacter sp. RBG_16_69_14]
MWLLATLTRRTPARRSAVTTTGPALKTKLRVPRPARGATGVSRLAKVMSGAARRSATGDQSQPKPSSLSGARWSAAESFTAPCMRTSPTAAMDARASVLMPGAAGVVCRGGGLARSSVRWFGAGAGLRVGAGRPPAHATASAARPATAIRPRR